MIKKLLLISSSFLMVGAVSAADYFDYKGYAAPNGSKKTFEATYFTCTPSESQLCIEKITEVKKSLSQGRNQMTRVVTYSDGSKSAKNIYTSKVYPKFSALTSRVVVYPDGSKYKQQYSGNIRKRSAHLLADMSSDYYSTAPLAEWVNTYTRTTSSSADGYASKSQNLFIENMRLLKKGNVKVKAGSYSGCISRVTDYGYGATAVDWLCPGVGRVKRFFDNGSTKYTWELTSMK